MKKILGILMVAVICILGLCSCAGPETRAKNQDLVDRLGDRLDEGQVVAENCYVKLYDHVHEKYYSIVDIQLVDPVHSGCVLVISEHSKSILCKKLIQYSNYIQVFYDESYTWDARDLANYDYGVLSAINYGGWIEISNNRVSYVIVGPKTV